MRRHDYMENGTNYLYLVYPFQKSGFLWCPERAQRAGRAMLRDKEANRTLAIIEWQKQNLYFMDIKAVRNLYKNSWSEENQKMLVLPSILFHVGTC